MYSFENSVFTEIEHTADIGIQASGRNREELFANLAFGMLHLLVENVGSPANKTLGIQLAEPSLEDLIVSWLSEIDYQFQVRFFFPHFIDYMSITEKGRSYFLQARLRGSRKINTDFFIKTEIKAVTYHHLVYTENDNDLTAKVIFDI